jgi:uncharacterized protein YdeI (YjbR/CyaY-like superfamily)
MITTRTAQLKRALQPMPDFVRNELETHGLMAEYQARPAYQRNDYLSWINRAKLEGTKRKRFTQMLEELRRGNVYMKMNWNSKP